MRPIDEILERWEEQYELGIDLTAEELCAEYPELLEEVRWQIDALRAIDSDFGMSAGDSPAMQSLADATYLPPDNISLMSRYSLKGFLASGGLGQVYVAVDEMLNRKVAIKFPKRQGMTAEQIARFEQEAMITGQLDHPGIVPIHALHSSQDGSEPCYVMRFVEGSTLGQSVEQFANEQQQFSVDHYHSDRMRHWLQSLVTICNIAAFAHERHIVHRDIKPSNILLGRFGETVLLDWGIAKNIGDPAVEPLSDAGTRALAGAAMQASPIQTVPGRTLGTPAYASPEQLLGQLTNVGPLSDVFSIGATLFFILAGKSPLELAGWSTHMQDVVRPESDLSRLLPRVVPAGLKAICRRALEIEPSRRYRSPVELASDLDRFMARESISVMPDTWWTSIGRMARKRPRLTGAVLASTVVLTIAAMASSTIVSRKNQQLNQSNLNLNAALVNVERANELAMQALRGTVDESVTKRFAEREALSDSDKSYLRSILNQYMSFASLQRSSERTLAIQAEAHRQIGAIFFHLGQNDEAFSHLNTAVEIYEDLSASQDPDKFRTEMAGVLEIIGTIEAGRGQNQRCIESTTKGIEILQSLMATVEDNLENEFEPIMANLFLVRAEAVRNSGRWQDAAKDFESALDILDRRIIANGSNSGLQFSVGTTLRAYASLLNEHAENGKDLRAAISFADRSIEILKTLVEQNPEVHRYQSALAWAYYDRSFVFQNREDISKAISDMYNAVDTVSKLSTRYPLIRAYREVLPMMLVRRTKLHLANDNLLFAIGDARNLSELDLSLPDITFAIQVMQRGIVDQDNPEKIDTDSLEHVADMLARRAKMQLELKLLSEARDDYKLATSYSQRLLQARPKHIFRREILITLLMDLAEVQQTLDEKQHAQSSLRRAEELLAEFIADHPTQAKPLQLRLDIVKTSIAAGE